MSREEDIIKICTAILEMPVNFWDNPNGPYEYTCPLCYEKEFRGGNSSGGIPSLTMNDIEHAQDCAYLIAKDLTTNLI